ncbi:MAG: DUF4164 family protein [Xanthobacteraceae bacterium]
MRDENGIEAAAKRLTQAIDALEAAMEQRLAADREDETLAEQLDAAAASARRLKTVNREVAQRLDAAIETIHSVLDAGEQ